MFKPSYPRKLHNIVTLTDNISFTRKVTEECLYSAELRMKKKKSVPGLPDRLLIKGNKDIMNWSLLSQQSASLLYNFYIRGILSMR